MAWVRDQDSCVSRVYHNVVSHHVRCFGWGGMGIKPSDFRVVPLTHDEHMYLHQHGEAEFWEDVGIDPRCIIAANLIVYMREVLHEPLSLDETDMLAGISYDAMIEFLEKRIETIGGVH